MRPASALVLVPAVAFGLACGGFFQSKTTAFEVLCDAHNTCETCKSAAADQRGPLLAQHIQEVVTERTALEAFMAISAAEPHQRGALLRRAASEEASLDRCGLADHLDQVESVRSAQALCALPTDCAAFDRDDPSTLLTCLGDEHPMATEELGRMGELGTPAMVRGVESYTRKLGVEPCELVIALRTPSAP